MTPQRRLVVAVLAALLSTVGVTATQAAGGTQLAAATQAATAARAWHLVALGDSIPYGGSYCGYCRPYPSLLAAALARQSGHPVTVADWAVPGLTTAKLLTNIGTRIDLRQAIAAADIVTITIGHNDTPWNSRHDSCDGLHAFFGPYRDARWSTYTGPCLAREADALRTRLGSVLASVRSLRAGRATLIEVTTDWNQVIGQASVTTSARQASKAVLDRFAQVTCAAARAASARCGDVYHAFNGPSGTLNAGLLLAADHDHASQAGHRTVAALLARYGYAPLTR